METGGKGSKVINHVRYIDGDQNQQPRRPDYNAPRSRNEIIYERQAGGWIVEQKIFGNAFFVLQQHDQRLIKTSEF
ncbi:hypothetical protein T12_8044 [Trichinella patagoniensis]|uniref:Uncharacterized protein n=1 Tax=Trichinella patagoniensis TaxID=990121 RepID=A0A0V1AFP3_9BILA|nr:hypothetical protein T12_8044 [Trichinella patagoniensis]KRZ94024.1 hypothetical protein T08_8679 [Trichinella sp. T8]